MGIFLIVLGILGWVASFITLVEAKTVFQEIAALLALGFGTLSLGLGTVAMRLAEIRDLLKAQAPNLPTAPEKQAAQVEPPAYATPADRFYLKDVSVDGIPGALFSDGSIDVVSAEGTATYRNEAELKVAYGR